MGVNRIDTKLGRMYTDGTKPYYSVTTILNKMNPKGYGFDNWLKNYSHYSETIVRAKAGLGTVVHDILDMMKADPTFVLDINFVEDYIKQNLSHVSIEYFKGVKSCVERVMKYVEAYIVWADDYAPTFLGTEVMLYHPKFDWAGSCDDPLQFANGVNMISDIKTGTQQDSHTLQGVAYALLWNAIFPKHQMTTVGILYINADYHIKPTYKFTTTELNTPKGRKLIAEWNKIMELFRIRYALKDGTYPIKPWYTPKTELKLNNVDHNFLINNQDKED
jgi:hypothetical protein